MMGFGALPCDEGVRFDLWAPAATRLTLLLRRDGQVRTVAPRRVGDGTWTATVADARAGDQYAYALNGSDPRPDPASRFQPDGVHGWSAIVDPARFDWTDHAWRGVDPRRVVLYELHVGTFAGRGTFRDVRDKLPYLQSLGVTALELMPLADFPGQRDWGYDGVSLFAPSRAYGSPDDLRSLIDGAHAHGLAVVIDVVYNHLGPEGAYLPSFSPQFLTHTHQTPWGDAVNLDDEGSERVRRLLIANACHWIREYHADGLRLDATHALIDNTARHFVAELTAAVRAAADRQVLVYAEDHRNLSVMVKDPDQGGWGLDGVWADDFHHVIRRMLAGDAHGYYEDYRGTSQELATILRQGWLYSGQQSVHARAPRGTDPSDVAMRKAVICLQNHDQIGNRAMGDRLHHAIDPAPWRAAVTILLTAPMTPLLFMGQEWSTSAPFRFFTHFEPELGRKVVEGRRREFKAFPEFATPAAAARIPDPQAEETFAASRLRWEEQVARGHATVLNLHRALLQLRNRSAALQGSDGCRGDARALDEDTLVVRRRAPEGTPDVLVVARLRGSGAVRVPEVTCDMVSLLLSTEDAAYAPDQQPPRIDYASGDVAFARPGALVFEMAGRP
jgi:maltooligosyltrehalose trehalohydrolase